MCVCVCILCVYVYVCESFACLKEISLQLCSKRFPEVKSKLYSLQEFNSFNINKADETPRALLLPKQPQCRTGSCPTRCSDDKEPELFFLWTSYDLLLEVKGKLRRSRLGLGFWRLGLGCRALFEAWLDVNAQGKAQMTVRPPASTLEGTSWRRRLRAVDRTAR